MSGVTNNDNYSGLEELKNTELMKNYNTSIVSEALIGHDGTSEVIDFGAGIGTLANILREDFNKNVKCVEIDPTGQKELKNRGFEVYEHISGVPAGVELIFSSNVLEHIQNDEKILAELVNRLQIGGHIFLYLPAKMFLWSELDVNVGHFRRYEITGLKTKCIENGLLIKRIHYADCLGFFASLCMKIFGYNKSNGIGSPKSLLFYDKFIFPVSRMLDKLGAKWIVGKNIVVLCQRIR
jgi:hypothetical protein